MASSLNRGPSAWLLVAAIGVAALTARFGVWQLDRAAQKEALQAAVQSQAALPPLAADTLPRTRADGPVLQHHASMRRRRAVGPSARQGAGGQRRQGGLRLRGGLQGYLLSGAVQLPNAESGCQRHDADCSRQQPGIRPSVEWQGHGGGR